VKRSGRLLPVLQLAEIEAEKAARALSFIKQKLDAETLKLEQLEQYQIECRNDLLSAGREGITAQQLMIFNRFTQKVDTAILQQRETIQGVARQMEQARTFWLQKDSRFRSLGKMIEKIKSEEAHLQMRQEQRNHDEYARRSRGRGPW
jgi:flagellar protein FliJ